jgi:lariat debranching enzyme
MSVKVAVVGCCHGELDTIYTKITTLPDHLHPELLIICGDFQSLRTESDFSSIAMPDKYKRLGDFHEYYTGKKKAPVLTIFIGGNHECGDYLTQLPHGGWVAPQIWYMGFSGIVWFKGLRIAGISGIYKDFDFYQQRLETTPLVGRAVRSVYHTRFEDVLQMLLIRDLNVNCFISHDWPVGIVYHGDMEKLLRRKPFFRGDIEKGQLGNPWYMTLLNQLMPNYWFSAHLHVKFEATVNHESGKRRMSDVQDRGDVKKQADNLSLGLKKNENEIGHCLDDVDETKLMTDKNEDEIELDLNETANIDEIELELKEVKKNTDEIELDLDDTNMVINETDIDRDFPHTESKKHTCARGFTQTNFLSLSKPLPNHPYLEVLDIPVTNEHISTSSPGLFYDEEFLKIIKWFTRFSKTQGFKKLRMDHLKTGALEQMYKDLDLIKIEGELKVDYGFEPTSENPTEQTTLFRERFAV